MYRPCFLPTSANLLRSLLVIGASGAITLSLLLVAGAQDKPRAPVAAPVKPELPATATIPADTVRVITERQKDAQIAAQEVRILELEIEKAQGELTKLKAKAEEAAAAAQTLVVEAARKAGIAPAEINKYEIMTGDGGAWVLRRRKE